MPSQKHNILQFNHYLKPDKMLYITYTSFKSLLKKTEEKSLTTKVACEHAPCGYSMSFISAFDTIENNHSLYRGEVCVKKFCISLGEYATNVINFERKKILSLTKKAKFTPRYSNMLHLWKNTLKEVC